MKALTIVILSTCLLLPGCYHEAAGQGVNVQYGSGNRNTIWNRGGISNFNVETRGKIELTDDDKDVKSMSPDAYLEVNKTVFGSKRTLIVTPLGNGLKKEYYEGRTLVAFEPEGRKWMGEVLPELVRSTTIGAESRVARFFRQGSTKAVLDEIRIIESDYVKVRYANLLMEQNVPVADYASVVGQVSETMNSVL